MRRGITESTLFVHNALPNLADAEILERAGLSDTSVPHDFPVLNLDWKYSFGPESEFIRLAPGQRQALRESDAKDMLKELREQGLAIYSLDATPEEIEKALGVALREAIKFYSDRGKKRLLNIRKVLGKSKDEMDEERHDYWAFHYNQAIADMLTEHLKATSKPSKPTKKAAA